MAITNTGAITFCNEDMRPLAEWLRSLKAMTSSMNDEWSVVHSLNVPDSGTEYLSDGREAEGVTQVTGEEMHDLMDLCNTIETALNTPINESLLSKFAVRPLRI